MSDTGMDTHLAAVELNSSSPDFVESKYRILAELGEGGSAIVYLAVARGPSGFNKLVVLKTLKRSLVDSVDLRRMFLQEARVAARLSHPGIVQTYEAVEREGIPVIVMEYLEGQPFSKVADPGSDNVSLAMRLRILADAAGALHYAHELADFDGTPLGLVHRDMTPHNVFVTFDGQVKLLDFGIAKLTSASSHDTQTGVIKGKLRYMPAEQIAGEGIDRRADIYAMGVMLWEAATNEKMWEGFSDATVMHRVLNGEVVSPRALHPELPEQLEKICMKALSSDPSQRHATAAELEAELEGLLDTMGERVTNRAIGKVVSEKFAQVREQTKALVEKQLSTVASLSSEEFETIDSAISATRVPLIGGNAGMQNTGSRSVATGTRTARRRTAAAVVLLALGATGLIALRATRHEAARQVDQAAKSTPANPAASVDEAAHPRQITVVVSASPRSARLFFDNELLPQNPFTRLLPSDGVQHIVRAEAPGYEPKSSAVVGERDTTVTLELEPAKVAGAAGKVHPQPLPKARGAGPAAPNCDPPYSLDATGIKKFKAECL